MKRILAYIILAVIALAAMGTLTGCTALRAGAYANADRYTAGDAEFTEPIDRIEIDWASGSVRILSHPGSTVLLSEEAEADMPEELRVRWWLEGSTLHVKFAASGARQRLTDRWHKALTLRLPEALSLGDVEIRAASANIEAETVAAKEIDVSTASGDMNLRCAANAIRLNSASGDIHLDQLDSAGEVSIESASGRIDANLTHVDDVRLEAASGRIDLSAASVDSLSAKTASGDISCTFEAAPSECRLRAVSGEVTLSLPEDADFSARISTTSGDFESDFPLKKDGRSYVCGSGAAGIEIDTTSGDISIRQN